MGYDREKKKWEVQVPVEIIKESATDDQTQYGRVISSLRLYYGDPPTQLEEGVQETTPPPALTQSTYQQHTEPLAKAQVNKVIDIANLTASHSGLGMAVRREYLKKKAA